MGKKIVLSVFGGIALLGVILMIIGVAMGGRPGSINVRQGRFTFENRQQSIPLAGAPVWMEDDGSTHIDPDHYVAGSDAKNEAVSFAASELKELDIDIGAGAVIIKTGDKPSLTVDGPLDYTQRFTDGKWQIESRHHDWWGVGRWPWGDNTTVFTITVPASFDKLDLDIGAGSANVAGLSLQKLNCSANAATVTVEDVSATEASMDVNAGDLKIIGFSGASCDLNCNAGSIDFEGTVSDELDADCSAGSIDVTTPRADHFSWEAEVNMGSISIDGKHHGAGFSGSSSGGDEGKPHFDLTCNMGDIKVNFS